uniref:GG12704 n=1 Tax=Drosophila erecta TaxID=7220 RepID=B3P2A8_DROER
MSRGRGKVRDSASHSGSKSAMDPPRCSICGTQQQLLRCAKCKAVYYCSPAHQHLHWPDHRTECRLLTRQKLNSSNNNKQQQLQQRQQIQQLQQAVASANLEGSGAGANCSTAQMMTPAHQAQSWPTEVDNLLNFLGQPGIQEKAAAAETEAGQRQQQHHHHGEKSSSYQIGFADASFMGSGSCFSGHQKGCELVWYTCRSRRCRT